MHLADLPDPWPGGEKVTAPDKISGDQFGISIHHSEIFSLSERSNRIPGGDAGRRCCLPISPRNQWIDYLSQQSDRSRQRRHPTSLADPFPSREIFSPSEHSTPTSRINSAGAAYLYRHDANGSTNFLSKLIAPDGSQNDQFWKNQFLSQVTCWPSGQPLPTGTAYRTRERLTSRLDANDPANFIEKVTAPDGATNDKFGRTISQTSEFLTIGAFNSDPGGLTDAGAAYLFRLDSNGSATFSQKVTAPDGAVQDFFGRSISQSGNLLAIGAPYADAGGLSNAGAAYLYRIESNGTTTYLNKITAPDGNGSEAFGTSLACNGNFLVVGASNADSSISGSTGAAYALPSRIQWLGQISKQICSS